MSAPSPDPPTIRFVDVDGIRLRTAVRGGGPELTLRATRADIRVRKPEGK